MSTDNLISDGDFENNATNAWILSDRSGINIDKDSGNKYCNIDSTASVMQHVTLQKGTEYLVSFDCKGLSLGTVQIIDSLSAEVYWEKDFNVNPQDEWHRESASFKLISDIAVLSLRFNNPWNQNETVLSVDNIDLSLSEFSFNTPLWVDLQGNASYDQPFEFQTRSEVPQQHDRLYVDNALIQDFPDTVADTNYRTDKFFTKSYESSTFKLVAVDDRDGKEYLLYQGLGSDLFKKDVIYL